MQFDTTHEYYLNDCVFYYCEDHRSLIIHHDVGSTTNRIVISGVNPETIKDFASGIVKRKTTTKKD